jgi:opacity protein-like surface antigen
MVAVVTALAVLTFLALTTSASAEWFGDLYAGASFTQKGDVDLSDGGTSLTVEDQEYKTSFLVGGRAGYWWSFLGVNLDINYFQPDPDSVTIVDPTFTLTGSTDLDVVSIGVNLMLRGQFVKDEQVPQGRFQPYIFAGPTLFISTLNFDATLTVPGVGTATLSQSDTDTSVGVTAGAGLTYMFTRNIGAFAEFRYTYNKPDFDIEGVTVKPTLNTYHALAGVTFRF